MAATREQRLQEFLLRLGRAPPASNAEEALALVSGTLNAVEDEMSAVPFDPAMPRSDGRMYPPGPDSVRLVPGRDGIRRYRSKAHNTYVGGNGAIRIDGVKGPCLLNKPGGDGAMISLPGDPAPGTDPGSSPR